MTSTISVRPVPPGRPDDVSDPADPAGPVVPVDRAGAVEDGSDVVPPEPEPGSTRPGRSDSSRRRLPLLHGRGLVGLVLVGVVVLLGLLAPVLAPYGPNQQIPGAYLLPSGAEHWLGTDSLSRDLLSRTLHGIRADLAIIFVAVPVGAVVGTLVGLAAAVHPAVDATAQRTFDIILAFPALILGIALTAVLGPGMLTVGIVIALAEIPTFGRMVRTQVITIREQPYVEAAAVIGAGPGWLARRHVLPNALPPLTVQLALGMSTAVFIEGGMSFLGLGIVPPDPSLGSLIREGMTHVYEAPLMTAGALGAVVALVLGFLLISQALAAARRS